MRILKVISKDGTPIAFERSGSGPALILVDGALMRDHQLGKPLPAGRWAAVTIPTLAVAGGKSLKEAYDG